MAKISPIKFMRQVREEAHKVTWATRKETIVTTIMVIVLVAIASVFFLIVDNILAFGVRAILGIGV